MRMSSLSCCRREARIDGRFVGSEALPARPHNGRMDRISSPSVGGLRRSEQRFLGAQTRQPTSGLGSADRQAVSGLGVGWSKRVSVFD